MPTLCLKTLDQYPQNHSHTFLTFLIMGYSISCPAESKKGLNMSVPNSHSPPVQTISFLSFCPSPNVSVRGCSHGNPKRRVCNEVQNSWCPGNIKNMGCPHPYKSELEDGTHGTGPLRVLHSNSFADNL